MGPAETVNQRGVVVRLPVAPGRLFTKKQLAAELGRSTRWIELRMREGLPTLPRRTPREHVRFDPAAVRAWLEDQPAARTPTLEDRLGRLEREVDRLAAALQREKA